MRVIRLFIISILVLVVIITIVSLFIPSHIRISRAVQINDSKEMVMEQLGDPANWRNWYPGADTSQFYYENGSIKGLILNKDRRQYIIITEKKADEVTAVYTLPNRKLATGWKVMASTGSNAVTVQWYIDFHLRWYPWEKFSSFMFEKIYNPQLEKGLDNLKKLSEK